MMVLTFIYLYYVLLDFNRAEGQPYGDCDDGVNFYLFISCTPRLQ